MSSPVCSITSCTKEAENGGYCLDHDPTDDDDDIQRAETLPAAPELSAADEKDRIGMVVHQAINKAPAEPTDAKTAFYVIPMEGRNLIARDVVRSDPYCAVTYGNDLFKTKVAARTLHPVWPWSVFMFQQKDGVDDIKFEVWDQDWNSDDILGDYTLKLSELKDPVTDVWLTLKIDASRKSKPKPHKKHGYGNIHVRIYAPGVPIPPLMEETLGKSFFLFDGADEAMKTGDMILYSGSEFVSGVIKKLTHTPYSHVGMVLKMKDPFKIDDPDAKEEVFLCEADWDDSDYLGDESVFGIIFNKFEDRMRKYSGDIIWHCPLATPLTDEEAKKVIAYALSKKQEQMQFNIKGGLKIFLHLPVKERPNAMFCSEFVSYALQHVDRIEKKINSSSMTPLILAQLPTFANGEMPTRVLRYQVEVDSKKLSSAGMSEIGEIFSGNKKATADGDGLAAAPLPTITFTNTETPVTGHLSLFFHGGSVDTKEDDIYAKVTFGRIVVKTKPHKKCKGAPRWDQKLTLQLVAVPMGSEATIQLWDFDRLSKDDHLASAKPITLADLVMENKEIELFAQKDGKKIGSITVSGALHR